MDGIDGIAGGQAVVAAIGWAFLARSRADEPTFWLALIAAASFGFLLENWPPARIFMGDVASAPLGLLFASLPFLARGDSATLAVPATLLLWRPRPLARHRIVAVHPARPRSHSASRALRTP